MRIILSFIILLNGKKFLLLLEMKVLRIETHTFLLSLCIPSDSPIEVSAPADITVTEGSPFTLPYEVRGIPEVTFNWTLNGTSITSSPPSISEAITQNTLYDIYKKSTLSSASALPEQGGVYAVTALNEHGFVTNYVNVIVNCMYFFLRYIF